MIVTVSCSNPTCTSKLVIIGERLHNGRRQRAIEAALKAQRWALRDPEPDAATAGGPVCVRCAT